MTGGVFVIRKIFSLLFVFVFMCSQVSADVIGHIYKTDIKAYENYMQIPSYNCGGTTVVFVRDLENYGYEILWDSAARKVIIEKNPSAEWSPIAPVYEGDEEVGTVLFDIYKTDIKTYYEKKEITSYNIGGQTAIIFRDLDTLSNLSFDAETRKASFLSENLALTSKKKKHIEYMYEILDCMSKLDYALEKADASAKNGKCDSGAVARVESVYSDFILLKQELQEYQEPDGFSESTMEIWWSMVNLQFAADVIKTSFEEYGSDESEKFKNLMLESYQQRNDGLRFLASEF